MNITFSKFYWFVLLATGVGKTVKEKVWMHTSRDIRGVAGQLVKLWIEVFRREKAQGMIKTVKKSSGSSPNATLGSQKLKVKDPLKSTVGTGKLTHSDAKCRPSIQSASPSADSNKVIISFNGLDFLSSGIAKFTVSSISQYWWALNRPQLVFAGIDRGGTEE